MNLVNLRLVLEKDDGGIRQSERQYIPQLKNKGVTVIGVVLGKGYGNYSDQKEDFQTLVECSISDYSGGLLSRFMKLFSNVIYSNSLAKSIYSGSISEIKNLSECNVIINVRRVNLISVALKIAKYCNGQVIFHSGNIFQPGPFGINHLYYWYLRRHPRVKILANSQFSASTYKLDSEDYVYPGFSWSRAVESVDKSNIRAELDIPDQAPVFLFLARVNWDKSPDLLMEGFLSSDYVKELGAHLIIAGPIQCDDLASKLNNLKKHPLGNYIHVVGKQVGVADWYAAADIFVNSRRGVEPFGISIVEAMAAGLPVLTSAYGGPRETVKDGVNGWLIADLTSGGYREGIDRSLRERHKWSEFGTNSAAMSDSFSVENQTLRYLKFAQKCPDSSD